MNHVPMKALLAACLFGSAAFAANAQNAPPTEVDTQAETRAQVESDEQATEAAHGDKHDNKHDGHLEDGEVDRNCLKYTGSHITPEVLEEKGKDCVTANGRVYTTEDIRRTGRSTVAEALRALDADVF